MPDFPAVGVLPRIETRNFTIAWLAAGGDDAFSTMGGISPDVTAAELADMRTQLADLSNAAVVGTTDSAKVQVNKAAAAISPLDESYSSSATRLVLVFQDNNLVEREISIPAPDETAFAADGVTADVNNVNIQNAIAAVELVLNGGAGGTGTFNFKTGYRQQNSRSTPKARIVKPSTEPGAGVQPPVGPGA